MKTCRIKSDQKVAEYKQQIFAGCDPDKDRNTEVITINLIRFMLNESISNDEHYNQEARKAAEQVANELYGIKV